MLGFYQQVGKIHLLSIKCLNVAWLNCSHFTFDLLNERPSRYTDTAWNPCTYLNSTISNQEFQEVTRQLRQNTLKLLYVAPERLDNEGFISFLRQQPISLVAIDEAHCVSQWGLISTELSKINHFIDYLPERPVLASFTATATDLVQEDIVKQLDLKTLKFLLIHLIGPILNLQFSNRITGKRLYIS